MKPILRDPAFISALVYFERVAIHSSFTRASEELGVTASAVSHRIKALETELGHRLFDRNPHRVSLTEAGARLQRAASEAFSNLDLVLAELLQTASLRVSIGPYLSVAWLMPRLAKFEAANPTVTVELVHLIGGPNLRDTSIAIYWAKEEAVPDGVQSLFSTIMKPVVAPQKAERKPVWELDVTPLHYRSRDPWMAWLKAAGGPEDFALQGEVFDDPNLVLEAAAHGRGAALGFEPFIDQHIQTGRLVAINAPEIASPENYWLIVGKNPNAAEQAFCDWLLNEAG